MKVSIRVMLLGSPVVMLAVALTACQSASQRSRSIFLPFPPAAKGDCIEHSCGRCPQDCQGLRQEAKCDSDQNRNPLEPYAYVWPPEQDEGEVITA